MHLDEVAALPGGQQRRLVDHVGQVGTGEAGRAAGDDRQVDVRGERLALGVHGEHRAPAFEVGPVDRDLPVEPAGPQQRRVEDVRPVGGRDEDDSALDVEAVHLDQQLVEGLLALVVAAAEAGAAVPADGVDLVHEDDRRRVGLGLLEQVAYPGGADADEHLDEVGAGDRVERHARLAGDRAGQQGLAGAGRPVQQDALGDLRADGLELGRALQELLDLLELLDRLVGAGHVGERGLGRVLADQLRFGLPEVHDPGPAALHRVHDEEQQEHDQQDRHQADQQADEDVLRADLGLERLVLLVEQLADPVHQAGRVRRGDLVVPVDLVLEGDVDGLLAVVDRDVRVVAALQLSERDRRRDLGVAAVPAEQGWHGEHDQQAEDDPEPRRLEDATTIHISAETPWAAAPVLPLLLVGAPGAHGDQSLVGKVHRALRRRRPPGSMALSGQRPNGLERSFTWCRPPA
jgi:hypothetical protein